MGAVVELRSQRTIALRSRCLLGRSPACDVRADDPRVSGEHASLCWTSAGWEVRDLASKNGTFVDGRRLAVQERAALAAGSRIGLGAAAEAPCEVLLVDASPPMASALHLGTGAVREAEGGVLLLPDDEHPRASLFEGGDGAWMLETASESFAVSDGEVVLIDGERWRLDLPVASATMDVGSQTMTIGAIALKIGVSADEERVEIRVVRSAEETLLPPRSYHYLLLTLARARLSGASAPEAERGWLERADLCRMLKTDEYRLNVDICRIRKQFATVGIQKASDVVQRRAGTGLLRLGVERVSVHRV